MSQRNYGRSQCLCGIPGAGASSAGAASSAAGASSAGASAGASSAGAASSAGGAASSGAASAAGASAVASGPAISCQLLFMLEHAAACTRYSCCNTQQRALAIIPAAGASDTASSAGGAGGDSSTAASPPAVVSPGVGSTAGAPAASSTGASTTTTVVVLLTTVFDAWGGEALAGVFAAVAVGSAAFDPEQPIAPARSCAQVDPFGGWTVCTRKVLLILKDRPGADDQGFLMRLSVFANFWGIQRAKTCQKESFGDHPGSLSE